MKKDKIRLIDEFIKNAVIQGESTLNGDYKTGNKASDKLFKIENIMKEDIELAQSMLAELIYSNEPNVKIWACGIALEIDYKKGEAEAILTQLSRMPDLGILGFNAEMVLKVQGDNIK